MADERELTEMRLVVKTKFREQLRGVIAHMQMRHRMRLDDIKEQLQLMVIYSQGVSKMALGVRSEKDEVFQSLCNGEQAMLELIAELCGQMEQDAPHG
jgi:hypothetical protein